MTILGISGSLRRDHNTRALRAAAHWLGEGVALEVWEGLKAIPPYDEDDDGPAAPASRSRSAIAGADAVLFATPEYNASIPGQLKNALDWVSRPLATNEPGQQARCRDRGLDRHVRRRLVAGRAWQGAEDDGRARGRGRRRGDERAEPLRRGHGKLVDEELCTELEAVLAQLVGEAHLTCGGRRRGRQGRLEDPGK